MKCMMIRYRTKPESSDENQRLIEQVFDELHRKSPPGVHYVALRLDGDVFVHLVSVAEDFTNPIPSLDAFQTFRKDIDQRCLEAPKQSDASVIGNFDALGR